MWYYLPDYKEWYNWWYGIEEVKYGIEDIKKDELLPNPIEPEIKVVKKHRW